ncbi:hypothetical protein SteCoe_36138 [Stentor coeruleus]|uniref:PPM-type phosphatase domain-containing protein n=1 Tax=Stentor coeruleus TaxID=5963 RepID=A0A1R2AQS8_9CILI|nr:hypothetical protein SteCoe_36138 [Stentor coeruleus]
MGSCALSKTDQEKSIIPVIQLQYSRQALIKIHKKDQTDASQEFSEIAFHLSEPLKTYSDLICISNRIFQLSLSIIPGLIPRLDQEKVCQDNCFALSNDEYIFIGLYDGHGFNGDKVSLFCSELAQNLFSVVKSFPDPIEFLKYVTDKCASELKKSDIDSSLSGCTQVLVLYLNSKIYCATLGDSRAVLASSNPPEMVPVSYNGPFHMNPLLVEVKQRRNSILSKNIVPVQLTFDQKPDLPEEMMRITQCGGRVEQLKSDDECGFGPFRVWEMKQNFPGLSVSRALGDFNCKKLGIISEPVCSMHTIGEEDYFLVVASDGIWDVMDNDDVINFIENYRRLCKSKTKISVQGHLVNPSNSSISQMLCEEARVRWFSIIKEEDVTIDDISCVILQLKDTPLKSHIKNQNPIAKPQILNENLETSKIKDYQNKDLKRGSLLIPSSNSPIFI